VGLREIHIDARDDGLEVWVKYFGFLPRLPDLLAAQYVRWARGRKGCDPEPPRQAMDYPVEFLKSRDTLELYKVIS
jgi:hypothetical protein